MRTPARRTLVRNPRHGTLAFANGNGADARDEFRYGPDGGCHFHKNAWRDGEAKRTGRIFHADRFKEWLPDPAVAICCPMSYISCPRCGKWRCRECKGSGENG